MRFYKKDVVFQEVPGEISLSYFICGCPLKCPGCHSSFTWNEHAGTKLTPDVFISDIKNYQGFLSCVLFMGGEWHEQELLKYLGIANKYGLKTCLYTGLESVSSELMHACTFLKTGPWISHLGGLDAPSTNQRFIQTDTGECLNAAFYKQPLAV
jgi:anaerobic ribonucleoside-triphosphate reductase activating protein